MYGQILTNKRGETVKILSHHQDIYIISYPNDHKVASGSNFTKQDLINLNWIFPVETEKEKWTPELSQSYFVPNIVNKSKHDLYIWRDDEGNKRSLANNLVCRTLEEAIALTDKMLGVVK